MDCPGCKVEKIGEMGGVEPPGNKSKGTVLFD